MYFTALHYTEHTCTALHLRHYLKTITCKAITHICQCVWPRGGVGGQSTQPKCSYTGLNEGGSVHSYLKWERLKVLKTPHIPGYLVKTVGDIDNLKQSIRNVQNT